MEDRVPNELRELVWRRLGHRDLCAASAVSRRWCPPAFKKANNISFEINQKLKLCRNDEIKRMPCAWRLGAAPLGRQPTTAPELLQALLAACPGTGGW